MLRAGRDRPAARSEDLSTRSPAGSRIHPAPDPGLGGGPWRGRSFILCHEHRPEECRIAIAAWKDYRSPLRGWRPLGSCASGGHRLWWTVQATDGAAALAQLPAYVADRTVAHEVREVAIP
jgi:hypothetical protein